jgi:hypothetical protein
LRAGLDELAFVRSAETGFFAGLEPGFVRAMGHILGEIGCK